jgi:hypothetical protein
VDNLSPPHQIGPGFMKHYVQCDGWLGRCDRCRMLDDALERQGYDVQDYREQMKEMIEVSNDG